MHRRHVPIALVVLATCPACGEMQEAEPLSKTVPAALAIAAVACFIGAVMLRAAVRAVRATRPGGDIRELAWPGAFATFALAPVVLPLALVAGAASWGVAFNYREPHVDIFTWEDTVVFTLVVLGAGLLLLGLTCLLTGAVVSRWRRQRVVGLLGLVLLAVTFAFANGYGLLWVPAIVLGLWTRRDTEPETPGGPPDDPAKRHVIATFSGATGS